MSGDPGVRRSAVNFSANSSSDYYYPGDDSSFWHRLEMITTRVCYGLLGSFVVVAAVVASASATSTRRSVIVNGTILSVPYCSREEQRYLPDAWLTTGGCPTANELFVDEEVIPNDSELYDPPSTMPWFMSPLSIKVVRAPSRDVVQMISNSIAMLIVLYVIYVIPLLVSSDEDQRFSRLRSYRAYPSDDPYDAT